MRFLLVILLLVLGLIFFAYPPLAEQSEGECSAVDQRVADLASHQSSGLLSVGQLYGSSSSAPSATAFVKDRYPLLPSVLGCPIVYWTTIINPMALASPAAPQPAPSSEPEALPEPNSASAAVVSTIARDITPNGDPISPATIFTLPMNAVAIRVDYPNGRPSAARFQLLQGRALLASCNAERSASGIAWCKFNVGLRKGNYSIAFTANNVLLGQFPFTVIGR